MDMYKCLVESRHTDRHTNLVINAHAHVPRVIANYFSCRDTMNAQDSCLYEIIVMSPIDSLQQTPSSSAWGLAPSGEDNLINEPWPPSIQSSFL